ncbi:enoyl-CoA hydratase/isomerase family protein [Shewanella sp. Isolate11]|uniref:enoyl-CoA hydratase/isomerase family protein n=1 Tax=Shewanella sp. Isolate11 TaxID=2908530 RepID=UPI001EFD054A|nr:enoyl-CoA hydratase/isomerase family protein [Shewanella sp. Isolate11]MCG9696913.1 enoyl-CoA hydratase/isomerase family protein [Shewanella sp. Isolate11]
MSNMQTNSVVFQTLGTLSGKLVGVATLNMEKALNALNTEMIHALSKQLQAWADDDSIAMVVLDGAGEKAFCAGGDVRALYQASLSHPGEVTNMARDFFKDEYHLDHMLHTYDKPVLLWGDGIVMGGGLGLMAGASHRVVTENSRIAMPEVTIGLYPDVGGSYFLNRMPGRIGLFLGMTAYNMSGADAYFVGLGNHYLNSDDKQPLFDALASVDWESDIGANHCKLNSLLDGMNSRCTIPMQPSVLELHQSEIDALMAGDLAQIMARVQTYETEHSWLQRGLKTLLAGSPLSVHLIYEQMRLGCELSLEQVFQFELGLSCHCCALGDFVEGVRALLIDKDRQPKWKYAGVDSVPQAVVQQLLSSPWSASEHPLSSLGK